MAIDNVTINLVLSMANWVRGVHRELGRYLQKDRNHDESNVYEDFVERNERKRKRSELIERF